jgi:hypothetical protein
MACLLDRDNVLSVYGDIYETILDHINTPKKGKFDATKYIKDLYADIAGSNDPKFALEVAQAAPEIMLQVIATRKNVREYFVKNKISQDPISEMSIRFEDVNAVSKFVTGEKESLAEVKEKIKSANKSKNQKPSENPTEDTINYSNVQDKAKVEDPQTTTYNFAVAADPDQLSEEDKDKQDPQKALSYLVFKQLILISDNKPSNTEDIVYQGVPLALRPISIKQFPTRADGTSLLVDNDRAHLEKNEDYDGVLLAVSDTEGNIMYFNEDGSLTDDTETGRPAYQYLRDVKLVKGKLQLVNRSGYAYTLVSAEDIIEREDNLIKERNGLGMLMSEKEAKIKKRKAEQRAKLNDLYRLRKHINENPDQVVTLKITGGSFGNFKNLYVPLADTELDLDAITNPIVGGGKSGFVQVTIKKSYPGVTVDHPVYLQRGDMDKVLAEKIATILTTDATYRGSQLSPNARRTYAEIFLGENIQKNNIEILTPEINGITTLTVSLNGEKLDLTDPLAKDRIVEHLLRAVKLKNGDTRPANVNYSDQYVNKTFTDYTVKDGKITRQEVDYFEFIKPYMKLEFSKESGAFFVNSNAYVSYAIPTEILPVKAKNYDVAAVTPVSKRTKTEIVEVRDSEDVEVVPGEITYNLKPVYNNYQVNDNVKKIPVTINVAVDFEKGDAKAAKQNAKNHIPVTLSKKARTKKTFDKVEILAANIVKNLNKYKSDTITVTGNHVVDMFRAGYSQKDVDTFMGILFDKIVSSPNLITPITKLVTTGETGISEGAIKGAIKAGIGVEVTVPKGWSHTVYWAKSKSGTFRASDEDQFLERFGVAPKKKSAAKKTSKRTTAKTKVATKTTTKKGATTKKATVEANKKVDRQVNLGAQASLLQRLRIRKDIYPDQDKLNRLETAERKLGNFFERLFTTKAERDSIFDWWKNHYMSKHIPLEVITEIVNSNAFATWSQHGITLHMANKATPIDLYHEAWHGFTQLFLTPEEKTNLYDELRKEPKWATATYFDIEEALAEDYRNYIVDTTLFTGIVGKIYKKVRDFLRAMFGKITRQDMTRPRDIAVVKELYDRLYKGEILDLKPSTDNIIFSRLNRASRTVKMLDTQDEESSPFTIDESNKLVNLLDSLTAAEIEYYNSKNNSSTGAVRLFSTLENRIDLYGSLKETIKALLDELTNDYVAIADQKDQLDLQKQLRSNIYLLEKAYTNFGDIEKSVNEKQGKGIIAYHIKKSRFRIVQEELLEDPTDLENTRILQDYKGNVIDPKKLAAPSTLSIISSIFRKDKQEDGTVTEALDVFGIPELEDISVMWSKLSRILAGSFDYAEMYRRLQNNLENYPEFQQILDMLRAPEIVKTSDKLQFKLETNFWQDFKKPRVKFIQYNINKTITQRKRKDEDGRVTPEVANYDTAVTRATPAIYSVIKDWRSNFTTTNTSVNSYVEIEETIPVLNTEKILEDFGDKNGVFKNEKSREFLEAMGIYLDRRSGELNALFNDKALFARAFQLQLIFDTIKKVNAASFSTDYAQVTAAEEFKRDPLTYLMNGVPTALRDKTGKLDVRTRIRMLAELQNFYSDGYSNFSVLSPEGNRLWEQVVDNTVTRIVTSINQADNWFELTDPLFDPNGRFKHMRWLADKNNVYSKHSVLLNSVFHLDDQLAENYGQKRMIQKGTRQIPVELVLNNVGGTQLVVKNNNDSIGNSTASLDATSKFLQEIHTMLLSGVEEFMRHASKNTAMAMSAENLITYPGKTDKHLYVDIDMFKPQNNGEGETEAFYILLNYISGELERIRRYKANDEYKNYEGYNRPIVSDGKKVDAAEVFTAFDDVLSKDMKQELYDLEGDLIEAVDNDSDLRDRLKAEVFSYFEKETQANLARLQEARFVDTSLYERGAQMGLNQNQVDEVLMKAYTYNSWIHKFETLILAYGDLVQYNHDKEEFHKRNAGLGSGGRGFRSDVQAQAFVNSLEKLYAANQNYKVRAYDGTFATAILKEKEIEKSVYYDEYLKELTDSIYKRIKNKTKAKQLAETALAEYFGMKEGDGQGVITFEAYRILKNLEGNWSDQQELLYKKVANGESITADEVIEYFPPYKLQYFGNIKAEGLPITSFHKFSLAPMIPFTTEPGSLINELHDKLMTDQIDYALFQTGSKVSHIGKGDNIINSDGTINKDEPLTENIIYAEYLKNQTEVNSEYKGKSIFSTQLRKLILEGLYEKGVIDTTEEDKITEPRVRKYLRDVAEYTETLKVELLDEIGFEKQGDKYVPRNSDSLEKLVELIRENLEIDDVIGDHLLEFVDVLEDGTLQYDLSLHPEALKIEKLVMSIINKRLIKQQVNGEPLVQVSAALYTGAFKRPEGKLKLGTDEDIKKYVGSNILPSYHKKADGFTAAMKVMIALQGDYNHLLNLEYKGEVIGTIDRLNEAIKDDEWLNADNGVNRKAITLVGVRIPVQGLNSMEFMEVYHFLPPQAGNIIVPPSEIVAKSGADFDIDKLTLYMANINQDGLMPERMFKNASELNDYLLDSSVDALEKETMLQLQKAHIQNELIDDIKNILELPQNYTSLITPNGTFLLKDLAEELSQYVMDYDPFQVKNGEQRVSVKGKKSISPTRVLETLYNIYKHESNVVGKNTLGLGAQENTFHTLINSLETPGGVAMPDTFTHSNEMDSRKSLLWLRHNTVNKNGKDLISIASRYDVTNQNKIADVISQMMNGWVDVEKDAWIFFIQGNYEVAPMLLYLVKAGVPINEAVYFVSQPLVREYVKEQRLAKSTFADVLNKKPESRNFVKYEAASNTLQKYIEPNLLDKLKKNRARYDFGLELANDIFDNRKNKFFTEEEMLKLIKDFKKNPNAGKSQLSVAMFLHFLQIEQQITGFTQLKMASRPDTSTKSTGSDVEQAEANIERLYGETKIEDTLLPLMRNDSVISSLFNNALALALNERLFPLRFNKAISNYLIGKNQQLREDSELIFGANKSDVFVNTFRNDIISFLYQQAARKFNLTDSYKSYTLKTKVPVTYVDLLQFGAYVKSDANGQKTMYIDEKALKKDFEAGVWRKNSDAQDSYTNRGLYPLTEGHFHSDHKTNAGEYIKFVTEREYLRSVYSKTEVSKTPQFKDELKTVKQENPKFTTDQAKAYTYEKILAIKALENTLNPYHMFKDKQYAYAIQFQNIVNKHAKGFVKNYAVLSRMKVESTDDKTMYNLYVGEKDFTNDTSNLFYKNLDDLANPAVKKVANEVENQYISDFFAKLPLYAFMQTGINKTKFSFTNVVDYNQFIYLVDAESKKLIKALANNNIANKILDVFYNRFVKENSRQNPNRGRYKNYLFNIDLDRLSELPTESTEDVNLDERFKMEEISDNTFIYDNQQATPDTYKEISNKNSDVTIAYAAPVTVIQGKEKPFGESLIREYSQEMSVAFPVALQYYRDGMANLAPDKYPAIKRAYDVAIQRLVEIQESGSPIAFPIEGIGDSEVMPQELFVYLSRELYQKFGYLNPGSTMYTEIRELIGEAQGITDREILEQLGLDEDPFTCKL